MKKNIKSIKFISTIILSILFISNPKFSYSQISEGGTPYSFFNKTLSNISQFQTEKFDVNQMLSEDKQNSGEIGAYRFGKVFDVELTPKNSGTLEILETGDKLWRLEILSPNAYSVGVFFDEYFLPKGSKLFVYSSDKKDIAGAFTDQNNKSYGKLAIGQVQTDKIIIEYFEPKNSEFGGKLKIGKIIHDYKNEFGAGKDAKIGDCHVNVACPQGLTWENEIQSVCKMSFLGWACSGAMINNTAQNGRPYFLTARHCVHDAEQAEAMVFIYNYQSDFCWRNYASQKEQTSGSRIVATPRLSEYDFTLLEMEEYPPASYNPYFAGWNSEDVVADSTTGIHHPGGEVKKISKDYDPPLTASVQAAGYNFLPLGHWKMFKVDTGFFEPGSSGSPLFNQDHEIIGDLSAVTFDHCDYPYGVMFAKFDKAWDWTDDPSQQLKFHLDPGNTGIKKIKGYKPIPYEFDIYPVSLRNFKSEYCKDEVAVSPTLKVQNMGVNTVTSMKITILQDGVNPKNVKWTGTLNAGKIIEIPMPELKLIPGQNEFRIITSEPNGIADDNPGNDELIYFSNVITDHYSVTFEFNSKALAKSTNWHLHTASDSLIFQEGPFVANSYVKINKELCLDVDCFNFKIDAYGSGEHKLYFTYTGEVIASGTNITEKETVYFCSNSVENITKNIIKIYPNPADEYISIDYNDLNITEIEITDMTGRTRFYSKFNIGSKQISTRFLESGIYFVKISTDKDVFTGKFIKTLNP